MSAVITRRQLLRGGLALAGATALGAVVLAVSDDDPGGGTDAAREASATYVAEASLAQDPSIGTEAQDLQRRLTAADEASRPAVLDRSVAADFGSGQVVRVDGWELARSESAYAVIRAGLVPG